MHAGQFSHAALLGAPGCDLYPWLSHLVTPASGEGRGKGGGVERGGGGGTGSSSVTVSVLSRILELLSFLLQYLTFWEKKFL